MQQLPKVDLSAGKCDPPAAGFGWAGWHHQSRSDTRALQQLGNPKCPNVTHLVLLWTENNKCV